MKRIVLIVPDKINHSHSTFKTDRAREKPVTRQLIIKALELDEYDETMYFPKGSVKVESIENIDSEYCI